MKRREVFRLGFGCAAASIVASAKSEKKPPVLDAHIHLFDPTREGGVPWPEKTDAAIYKPTLPHRYEQITCSLGVVGAIAVEASPLESDNDWTLRQAADNPIIVGFVGNLIPGTASYAGQLERLRANPLFLGIRYGNLWDRDLFLDWKKPGFMADLARLASAGLVLETANPNARLVEAILAISQQLPELKIVIDHLPAAPIPVEKEPKQEYLAHLRALARNPRVFIKLSEVPVRVGNTVPMKVAFYKERLDAIWDAFGEDHILFGSDWPNSDHLAGYEETLTLVRDYVGTKGPVALEKYFWKNSIAAYGWRPRRPDQRIV
jgi:predicted TIM-barrel fold metal-dependent hydrolase